MDVKRHLICVTAVTRVAIVLFPIGKDVDSIRSGIGENIEDIYLFKAKRIDNGEWVTGSYVYTFTPGRGHVVGIMGDTHFIVEENGNIVPINEDTICQCTGLKDKNGNLIWENDILKYDWGGTRIDFIKYDPPIFTYSQSMRWNLQQDEVIGNIFDNPELLESEE